MASARVFSSSQHLQGSAWTTWRRYFVTGLVKSLSVQYPVMSGRIPTCDEGPHINVIVDNSINCFLLLS